MDLVKQSVPYFYMGAQRQRWYIMYYAIYIVHKMMYSMKYEMRVGKPYKRI